MLFLPLRAELAPAALPIFTIRCNKKCMVVNGSVTLQSTCTLQSVEPFTPKTMGQRECVGASMNQNIVITRKFHLKFFYGSVTVAPETQAFLIKWLVESRPGYVRVNNKVAVSRCQNCSHEVITDES